MSHIRRKTARKSNSIKIFLYGCVFLCLFTVFELFANTAHAATTTYGNNNTNPKYVLKTELSTLVGETHVTMDWRSPSYVLNFNLPTHEWYEELDVFLSVYPEGNVSRRTPLLVSYNNAPPVSLNGQGSRFDAHIRLDPSRIRASNNTIKITYQTPSGANCLQPNDGKWVLDLSRSKLVAKARAKKRPLQLSEIEAKLAHPMSTPKRVALLATGQNSNALEAIIAQGIAQRTHALPSFQFTNKLSDFTVLIGTPEHIRTRVNNKKKLGTDSPVIFVDTGPHPKLVLSAPNENQLLDLTRAFSSFHLPTTRQTSATLFELYSNQPLAKTPILSANTYKLSGIGDVSLPVSWTPKPVSLKFNIEDAHATSGVLTLHIAANVASNPTSKLRVNINDRSIGYTLLDKKSKKVAFDIAPGILKASNNTLSISPDFASASGQLTCASAQNIPTVLIRSQSKLSLTTTAPTPIMDLGYMVSSGGVFGQMATQTNTQQGTDFDEETALILTAKSAKDRAATLHILGFAARQFGPKWVNAEYLTELPSVSGLRTEGTEGASVTARNLLIIGPNAMKNTHLISVAPNALKLAVSGKSFAGNDIRPAATRTKQASTNPDMAFKIAAQNIGAPSRIRAGGFAAMFASPYTEGKMIGVISSTQATQYATAMKTLANPQYWNALQGSVTRWDKNAVLMAQISPPNPTPQNTNQKVSKRFAVWLRQKSSKTSGWFSRTSTIEKSPKPQEYVVSLNPRPDMVPVPHLKSKIKSSAPVLNTPHIQAAGLSTIVREKMSGMKAGISGLQTTTEVQMGAFKDWLRKTSRSRALLLFLLALGGFLLAGLIPSKKT